MDLKLELEENCDNCYRGQHEERKPKNCKFCGGTGLVPSQTGKELLKFISEYMKVCPIYEHSHELDVKNENHKLW